MIGGILESMVDAMLSSQIWPNVTSIFCSLFVFVLFLFLSTYLFIFTRGYPSPVVSLSVCGWVGIRKKILLVRQRFCEVSGGFVRFHRKNALYTEY